ncbi:MAG: DUF938 domain-containing protein [Gammaproteobacteria bacterium]|nr:DUF938 domain-containing protein [Gammaproteobacteria bacterium]
MKPYSESCDQNRDPIFSIIDSLFAECSSVLEIGSGTGQHAVYFAARLPHLLWYTSDLPEYHRGIRQWLDEAALSNTRGPLPLDVCQPEWQVPVVDAIFSANTLHIMHWSMVEAFFHDIGQRLCPGGRLVLYGPFNYRGGYTSESNARFDLWLKARDPLSGIRDFEAVDSLARQAGLVLENDHEMPANNRILCWGRADATR